MQARYIKNPDYSYEKINRASVACGPLVKWAIAQVSFQNFKHSLF
jgi:dynein heavy chain 1